MLYTSPRQPNPSIQPSIHPHILPRCYIHLRRAFMMILYQRINLPFLLLLSLKCSDMSMIKSRLIQISQRCLPLLSCTISFVTWPEGTQMFTQTMCFLNKMFPKEFVKSSFKEQHLKHHSILNDQA